jgi:beta-glucanase (GH16 family)
MKGIPSTWCRTFHTYGVRIMPDVTTYYYDNVEMCHHKTLPISQKYPLFFLINLATGGGWPVDLSRYGKGDMYVDWVRVYGTDASPREVPKDNKAAANDPNASHL